MPSVLDDLCERIMEALDVSLKHEIESNTIVINGNKYGYLPKHTGCRPTIFGMTVETENMPKEYDFCLQRREEPPQTNADRIRAMSNEELAEWTNHNCHCPPPFLDMFCPFRTDSMQTKSCQECWLDWLQSPVGGAE